MGNRKKKTLLYIGNKLSHHGYSPGVIETLGPLLEHAGFKVQYAGTAKSPVLRLAQMLIIVFIYGRRASFILIDTYSTNAFWFAFIIGGLAKIINRRYMPILHGGDLPTRLKRSKLASDLLFKNAYVNVAVSGYLQKAFEKVGYHTYIVPNCINIENYPFRQRNILKPNLLWVRAFGKIYNPNMAIDVLSKLRQRYPDARLCMVGPDRDGSMADFIKYAKIKGVSDYITVTGKLSKEEWINLSENYDFFINTTNVDNTPVSVIEAMALGLPIVSTNPGGISYLLKADKEAILVNIGDSNAMVKAIDYLLQNPLEAIELSKAARVKAESFASEQIMEKWVNLLSN